MLSHLLEVAEDVGRPDYGWIAHMEHQEDQERPGAFLPHNCDEVTEACPECRPDRDAKVIPLRPDEDRQAHEERPGAPEEHPEQEEPSVPEEPVEGVVLPPEPDEPLLPWRAQIERQPVIPGWQRNAQERKAAAQRFVAHVSHKARFHAYRSPLYLGRIIWRSPLGVQRSVAHFFRWVSDAEGKPLRSHTVDSKSTAEYMALSRQRNDRVKVRGVTAVLSGGGAVIGWFVGSMFVPHLGLYIIIAAVLIAGVYGRRLDRPLIDNPVLSDPAALRLTSEVVIRALGALGDAEINKALSKNGPGITFAAPITRDGPGWRADVDLPHGVTANDIIAKRAELASGLRRPLGAVWPESVPEIHPGRLLLWVGDQDMNKAKQPPWTLAKRGAADLFAPVPFGTDVRGRWVPLTLMYTSIIIGAIPRMGKTFLLRLLLLIAALDVRTEIHAYDLKGTGDLSPLEPVAHRYRPGDDADDIEYAIADLRELREELRRRAKVIRELPKDVCPENKVTPELASKKSLRLHPIVIAADECQVWFEHQEYGKEFEAICTDLVKRGPALGMIIMLATQRPDAKSLPTGISANASVRFCLKVMGQTENDMVLGTSMYKSGIRATTFAWADKGIVYFRGEGTDPLIVRGVNVNAPQAEAIALRARDIREKAGLLSGYAIGYEPDQEAIGPAVDMLADIASVFRGDEELWSERIIERLQELRPGVYDGLNPRAFGTQVNEAFGIQTEQIWDPDTESKNKNRRGLKRQVVDAALERRSASG